MEADERVDDARAHRIGAAKRRRRRVGGRIEEDIFVLLVAGLLLLSYGGAIYAAPITVPLLTYQAWTGSSEWFFRVAAGTISGLTIAECTWALLYRTVGETNIFIWIGPIVTCLAFWTVLIFRARRIPYLDE